MASIDGDSVRLKNLERENQRLRRAVEELSVLNELATAIGASREMQEIMQKIIRRSLQAVHAQQGVITLVGEDASDPTRTLVRTSSSSSDHEALRPDQNLLGWMHVYKMPLLLNEPRSDPRFRGTSWDTAVQSILSVPMVVQSRLTGILTLYNKKDAGGFTTDDQRLLAIIASQSAQVVENARLHAEEQKLIRMQEELRLAYQIQTTLLPEEQPELPNYDIAGASLPAQEVGGDYFDFIPLEDHQLAVCVGDVSGKGLPAALMMANVQATLRGQAIVGPTPKFTLERANRLLCNSIRRGSFVTLFYGTLDIETHRFQYANAGHNRPLLLRPGAELETLSLGSLVLGFLPNLTYQEAAFTFNPGDLLLIYSDGITEAMNLDHELFGEERLKTLLQAHTDTAAVQIVDKILKAVAEHTGTEPQTDDMTMVIIKRTH